MQCMSKLVSLVVSACLLSVAVCASLASQQPSPPAPGRKAGDLRFEPYKLQFEGQSVEAEIGRLIVKENRQNPKSNLIELAFVRLKSTSPQPGPPVIYLDGGPGSSAINLARAPDYARAFLKLREVGDVILLDQRGVGLSRPNLSRAATRPMPTDAFLSREKAFAVFKQRAEEAAEHFKSTGVDLLAYNTRESAADVDDLRRALGVERVNLVGFSYGTHLGLATIRYHGAHLNRVALIGTEGPNHTRKLPSTSQKSLERLARVAAADPTVGPKVPDMVGMLRRVFERLEKEPITVRVIDRRRNQPVDVMVGKFGLQLIILIDLGDTNDLPVFPALFYTVDRGDYSILARFVEKRFNQYGMGGNMMTLVMDASSGATKERDAQIRREAGGAIFGDTINFPFPEIGQVFGNPDLGDGFRSPIRTGVPTLFISGTFDNNTPPFQADEVRKTFKHSSHIIVENAGHESSLVEPRVQQAMVDFLRGKDVSNVKISLPPLRFEQIPEPKTDARN